MKTSFEYHDPGIPGWMSPEELEWLFHQATHYKTIVEIGSAYGRSSHALLSGNNFTYGSSGVVYCVDPWFGKDSDLIFDERTKDLDRRRTFMDKVSQFPNLRILEIPSALAHGALKEQPVDMVFLDGGTDNIQEHLNTWLSYGFPRKLICGHDYCDKYPNVKTAVENMFGDVLELVPKTSIWFVKIEWELIK